MSCVVEQMRREDWAQVRSIYAEGLATGIAAFMVNPPKWPDWDSSALSIGRLVARNPDGRVMGWGALKAVADT
jgi:phosphinothricin acetyltransferase